MNMNKVALGRTEWVVNDKQTAAAATASKAGVTITGISPAQRHVVTGFSVSVDRITTTAAELLVKDGTTVIFQYEIPVGFYGPFQVTLARPYVAAQGALVSCATSGTLGTGVVCSVSIQGMTISD